MGKIKSFLLLSSVIFLTSFSFNIETEHIVTELIEIPDRGLGFIKLDLRESHGIFITIPVNITVDSCKHIYKKI